MAKIIIPSRLGNNFASGINAFYSILDQINNVAPEEPLIFDFSNCYFLGPFFLLPLKLLLEREAQYRQVTIIPPDSNSNFGNYYGIIRYPEGLYHENELAENLNTFRFKTYTPIVCFPASRLGNEPQLRDSCLTIVNSILKHQTGLSGGMLTGLMYLIDEAVNNIVDHSDSLRGYLFAQYYPSKSYLDLCIADNGLGILKNYLRSGYTIYHSDKEALVAAISGVSTKNRPEAEGRGFGIQTSKKMLVDGLKGKYFLQTGRAIAFKTIDNEQVVEIPEPLGFQGTFLALRIPNIGNNNFDPSDYYS